MAIDCYAVNARFTLPVGIVSLNASILYKLQIDDIGFCVNCNSDYNYIFLFQNILSLALLAAA